MKICFISLKSYQLFNPKVLSVFGGAEVQLSLFAKEFAKHKDLDVSVIVADYGQPEKEIIDHVTLWRKVSFQDPMWKRAFSLFRIILKIDADVYVKRGITLSCAFMAFFCKVLRKKFVYMVAHDDEVDGKKEVYKHWYGKYFVNYLFRNATIIVQNEYQSEMLKKKGIATLMLKSGYVLPDHLDASGKQGVLWVSRSKKRKRPEAFFALAKAFPQEKFVMICPQATGEDSYFLKLKEESHQYSNLEFIDFVPFDEIDEYFKRAKIFVNTSVSEGFPNTYIQALKNKTPILALTVDPDQAIRTHDIGIVCDDDMARLLTGLGELLGDNARLHAMQDRGFTYVHRYHNIKHNADQLLKTIQHL